MRMIDLPTAGRSLGWFARTGLCTGGREQRSIAKRLLSDKKTVGGVPDFILPTGIGKVE